MIKLTVQILNATRNQQQSCHQTMQNLIPCFTMHPGNEVGKCSHDGDLPVRAFADCCHGGVFGETRGGESWQTARKDGLFSFKASELNWTQAAAAAGRWIYVAVLSTRHQAGGCKVEGTGSGCLMQPNIWR